MSSNYLKISSLLISVAGSQTPFYWFP